MKAGWRDAAFALRDLAVSNMHVHCFSTFDFNYMFYYQIYIYNSIKYVLLMFLFTYLFYYIRYI